MKLPSSTSRTPCSYGSISGYKSVRTHLLSLPLILAQRSIDAVPGFLLLIAFTLMQTRANGKGVSSVCSGSPLSSLQERIEERARNRFSAFYFTSTARRFHRPGVGFCRFFANKRVRLRCALAHLPIRLRQIQAG